MSFMHADLRISKLLYGTFLTTTIIKTHLRFGFAPVLIIIAPTCCQYSVAFDTVESQLCKIS